jgi:Secretion system C-terminal sorting domain
MGTGYTSAPTVTVNSSNTPTAGSGATVTALVNPNINSAGATTTTLGANGSAGVQIANSRGTGTGTWASGGTTITFTVALANMTNVVGAYITGTGITLGTKVTAVSGTAIGQTITLDAPTTAAATGAAFTMFKLTGTVGGAGGAGGNGGAGGLATGNTYDATFAVGNNGTAPGGGGSGAISETGTIAGGAGADGRVVLTYSAVLPIELSKFEVKSTQKTALLSWTTASEKSNARFDIEQSTNGTDFQTIAEVKGNGSTNSVSNYNFEHATPSVGVNYYRLKQVDFDGTATLSPVKSVVFGKNGSVVKTTLVQDRLDVFVGNEVSTPLSIFNIAGQQVLSAKVQGQQSLDVSSLPAGLYFLNIDAAGVRTSTKFVKQ